MKVAIITFWWTEENYGQVLQLYALYEWLRIEGHTVEIVKFIPNSNAKIKIKNIRGKSLFKLSVSFYNRFIKGRYTKHKLMNQRNRNPRYFEEFRKEYLEFTDLEYYSINDLCKIPPVADAYICGSDQIWNYLSTSINGIGRKNAYTAQFGSDKIKRISYAASFGFAGINENVGRKLASNLLSFEGVSVREAHAKEIFTEYGLKNIVVVPDPTFLLQKADYMNIINENLDLRFDCPDVFIYAVQNKSALSLEEITKALDEKNITYLATGANNVTDSKLNYFPTVPEWLYVLDKSKTVITNSFHGCVFSILFQKNFYYYPLLPNNEGHVDTRIDSLLGRLGIEGRAVRTKEELSEMIRNPYKPIDWESVKIKQEEFVQVGKDFLAKHLKEAVK